MALRCINPKAPWAPTSIEIAPVLLQSADVLIDGIERSIRGTLRKGGNQELTLRHAFRLSPRVAGTA